MALARHPAVPRRPRRQPAAPARAAAARERPRRRPHRRRASCARPRTTRSATSVRAAARRRPALGDRRRVPPRVLAHGLHLPARRHHQGAEDDLKVQFHNDRGRHRVHAGGAAGRRPARRVARRSSATTSRSCATRSATAQTPKLTIPSPSMVHYRGGARLDRRRRLPRPRRVLGRPDRRLRRGGAAARRARLHATCSSTTRRLAYLNDPRQREHVARDRRRRRAPARGLHPPHQRGARRAGRRAWP